MLTNPPDTPPPSEYEAAIALMQEYDCSYQDAQRHLRLLNGGHGSQQQGHMSQEQDREEYDEEELGPGEGMVAFTPKQLRALASFLNGSPVRLRPPPPSSFCARTCLKLKALKRKLRCLKLLLPQRLYRAIKQRNSSSYNRLASVELSTSSSQHVKRQRQAASGRWREADEDGQWVDGLEEQAQQLQEYLSSHRELLDGVKAVTREGVNVIVPIPMTLPARIQPLLFVRRDNSQEIAENVKVAAQKTCKIICLENADFSKLFPAASGQAVVIAACNVFLEVQVLSQWGTALSMEDVDCIPLKFKEFLIKNRLFQSILDRDLTPHSFIHHHHQITSFPQEEDDDYEEGTEQSHREADTHQSIIREQDMLYQSMLSTYTAQQTEKQAADQETLLRERLKQSLRQSLRDQPSPCPSSTVQLSFRTPSGSVLSRRFLLSDTVQYVGGWVWSSEEVEWEETGKFELYNGYPPVLLDCPPSETLGNAFGEEGHVRLIIKET